MKYFKRRKLNIYKLKRYLARNYLSFAGVSFVFLILSFSLYFAFSSDDLNKTFKVGRHYTVVSDTEVRDIPDNDFLKNVPQYKKAFKDMSLSFISNEAIAKETIEKTGDVKKIDTKTENKIISSNFPLNGMDITSEYKDVSSYDVDGSSNLKEYKQAIRIRNTSGNDQVITFSNKMVIDADMVEYRGREFPITEKELIFEGEKKTASVTELSGGSQIEGLDQFKNYQDTYWEGVALRFITRGGQQASYNWRDAAEFDHEVRVYKDKESGENIIEFVVNDFPVSANSESIIDPVFGLDDSKNYDVRYDGIATSTFSYLSSNSNLAIGDVNGDGYNDLLMGSYRANYNGTDSGSIFVVFGKVNTASSTRPLNISTNYNIRYDGRLGESLGKDNNIHIGDVNGDGESDLLIGSYVDKGAVYVIFSDLINDVATNTTGVIKSLYDSANYNIRYEGAVTNDYLSYKGSLKIGDVNGDGLSDLVMGAYAADNNGSQSGSAYVMYSDLINDVATTTTGIDKSLGTASNYNIRYDGNSSQNFVYYRNSISIGDVNSDGVSDLVLGAPSAANNGTQSGSVYVIYSDLINDVATTTTGVNKLLSTGTNYNIRYDGYSASDFLAGEGCIRIADINNDGYSDLLLGARKDGVLNDPGTVYIIYSALIDNVATTTTGVNKPLNTITNYNIRYAGGSNYEYMTESDTLAIGDVNGDGKSDLVIGAMEASYIVEGGGSAYVIYSNMIDVATTTTGVNRSLATASNYNIRYDGYDTNTYTYFSYITKIGDVNGDGNSDLIFSHPESRGVFSGSGSFYIIYSTLIDDVATTTTGVTKSMASSTSYTIRYEGDIWNYMGYNGLLIDDFNGDGLTDIIIPKESSSFQGQGSGSVYVNYSTMMDDVASTSYGIYRRLATSTYNIRYDGTDGGDSSLGKSGVLAVGDVNADGINDLLMGAPNGFNNISFDTGSVYLIFGQKYPDVSGNIPLDISTNYNIRYDGASSSDYLSNDGILIDDINGDGYEDLIIASSYMSNNGEYSGSVYVLFSTLIDNESTSTTGVIKSFGNPVNYNIRYDGASAGDYLSSDRTLRTGDVNSDGLSDLVIGTYQADNNGYSSGSVYVFFSTLIDDVLTTGVNKPLSTASNYNIRYDGGAAYDFLSQQGTIQIGDVNSDGLSDLVIGARGASYSAASAGSAYVIYSTLIDDVVTTGVNKSLGTGGNYNIRYNGQAVSDSLTNTGAIAIGDVNGDGLSDLVLGASGANNNGTDSGSVYVMYSTLIDDVTTTGNSKNFSTASNYNIRYNGGAAYDYLSYYAIIIGDVNSDGKSDLVLGAYGADNNGSFSGSGYVMFSTLIDDVTTTGNSKNLNTLTNYSIRYDGPSSNDSLFKFSAIGDVNNDGMSDLLLQANTDYVMTSGGSVYVMLSSSIDDYNSSTGNNLPLSTLTNFNKRYDTTNTAAVFGTNGIFVEDINNDGLNDLIFPIPTADFNGNDSGSVYVIYGAPARPVYYSVGQNTSDHKTGSPTMTMSGGVATFSVAQTATNLGVGDKVTTGTGGTMSYYIASKSSTTVWNLVDNLGRVPDDISVATTVVSIAHAYASLSAAISGASDSTHLNTADLTGLNVQLHLPCYYDSGPDTTAVTVSGYTTSEDNYIKIYTPYNTMTEVNQSQRHNGVWDDNKYNLQPSAANTAISVQLDYTVIDGLQITVAPSTTYRYAITASGADGGIIISNNIVRQTNSQLLVGGIYIPVGTTGYTIYIFNNIGYGFSGSAFNVAGTTDEGITKLYNNTAYNSKTGFYTGYFDAVAINNVTQNCADGYYGTFYSGSDYNISDIATDAPGTHSKNSTVVQFVDAYAKNFHLSPDDTAAIDAGTSTVIASVSEAIYDIDGHYRRTIDIGADEASIDHVGTVWASGNGDFTTLSSWETGVQADLVATTTAVFSVTSDSGTFTKGNTYTGQSSGATATLEHKASTTDQVLLSNISGTFESGEVITDGSGTMTLTDAGNPANAVARIDGAWSVHDTADVNIVGWTTGVNNYIRIYTTDTARHKGRWDDTKYVLEDNSSGNGIWTQNNNNAFYYIRIDGLQVFLNHSQTFRSAIYFTDHGHFYVSNCIIKGNNSTASQQGINYYETSASGGEAFMYFWNNIIYDFVADSSGSYPIQAYVLNGSINSRVYFYNNTAKGGKYGMYSNSSNSVSEFKNNIVEDSYEKDYNLTNSGPVSSNNISSDWTAPGTDSMTTTTVTFMDAANNDFRLSPTDTYAKNNGTTTPLSVLGNTMYDIQGTLRGASFDIGADELTTEFVSTICENTSAGGACGNLDYKTLYRWEDKVESDLTAASTRVFTGTVVGTLNENDTVTLYENTVPTSITATVVATTSDQILLDNIDVGTASATYSLIVNGNLIRVDNGFTWRVNSSNYFFIDATGDELGASPIATAKIDGAWSTADTNAVNIDDNPWRTDIDNNIKVYTTTIARHKGKWDDTKYRLSVSSTGYCIYVDENNITIDGLQIYNSYTGGSHSNIYITDGWDDIPERKYISNNIIRGRTDYSDGLVHKGMGKIGGSPAPGSKVFIYNNIIYDFDGSSLNGYGIETGPGETIRNFYIYNNTFYNINDYAILEYAPVVAINNIAQDITSGTAFGNSPFVGGSDYNISDDTSTTGGSHDQTQKTINFISKVSGAEDFHLADSDTIAINAGKDLSGTSTVNYLNDIDGALRSSDDLGWDIGADEVAAKQYRSVGNTVGSLGAVGTVTISSTTRIAVFLLPQADNVGVGDVIQYGPSGGYKLAFITGRISSTQYSVQAWDTKAPTATTSAAFNIYRAHYLLDDWADQVETDVNDTISNTVSNLVLVNDDLIASNTIMMVPAYYSSTGQDTVLATISTNWTTGPMNYINIYTPYKTIEVGTSQRHDGRWTEERYALTYTTTSSWNRLLFVYAPYTVIDGLQIKLICAHTDCYALAITEEALSLTVKNNIIVGDVRISTGNNYGLHLANSIKNVNIYNNIIYGFRNQNSVAGDCFRIGGTWDDLTNYFYNNVAYDCYHGFDSQNINVYFKNNIAQNSVYPFYGFSGGTFAAGSGNNISSGSVVPGIDSQSNTVVDFVDAYAKDFHLAQSDTAARDAGTSTVIASVSEAIYDIDGHYRRTIDIGADEASVDHVGTIWESGNGDFTTLAQWEAGVQADLVATTTAVFSVTSDSGTFTKGNTYTGQSSGATATLEHKASTTDQVLLSNISGTFESGEVIIDGSGTMTLADAGNPANAVARIDGVWNTADTLVDIIGWSTGANNHIRIYTTDTARHKGVWNDNKYRIEFSTANEYGIYITTPHVEIDGLQIYLKHLTSSQEGIRYNGSESFDLKIKNNIIKGVNGSSYSYGIEINTAVSSGLNEKFYAINNIIYDIGKTNTSAAGITKSGAGGYLYIYGNTISNCYKGIRETSTTGKIYVKNNISQNNVYDFYMESNDETNSSNNISSDWTAPGTDSMTTTTVTFMDAANDDFRLSSTDTYAKDNGTSTPLSTLGDTMYDIQGTLRGANWDIGADELTTEYVSTVCETTSTGGDCINLDYKTLSQWEDKVESDLTLPSTRVFGGSLTGTLNEDDGITLYENSVPTSITATVVATTSDQILIDNINVGTASATYAVIVNGNLISVASSSYWKKTSAPANYWTVGGISGSDVLGASPIAVAKIDGTWGAPDTTTVTIQDWNTDIDNKIKIYTTITAQHNGKWDAGKYNLDFDNGEVLNIRESFVDVEGLQIDKIETSSGGNARAILIYVLDNEDSMINISKNIIKQGSGRSGNDSLAGIESNNSYANLNIYNNIFYGFTWTGDFSINLTTYNLAYIYNNTIYNSKGGINAGVGGTGLKQGIVINNLVASTTNPFAGTFHASSTHNATDISDTPSGASGTTTQNAVINFVSTTSGSEDFHLLFDNSAVKDTGYDLSSDPYLRVLDDIDGHTRPFDGAYDIGADEYALYTIYRSNGPGKTTAVDTDNSQTETLTIASNGTATFSAAIADNVGVGDAIIYDINADNVLNGSDAIVFISARASSTQYTVQDEDGTTPDNTIVDTDKWSIYRAYTSLSNAEAGTINTGISSLGITFDSWSGGRDLVTNAEQWNIACYADAVDTGSVNISGWTTGSNNYLKIFTPRNTNEVGVSQRHSGVWDDGKFNTDSEIWIQDTDPHVVIDGLQIKTIGSGSWNMGIGVDDTVDSGLNIIKNNIIKSGLTSSATYSHGVYLRAGSISTDYIFNNIIYGFDTSVNDDSGIFEYSGGNDIIANNTVFGNNYGIRVNINSTLINNIFTDNINKDYNWTAGSITKRNNISGDTSFSGASTNYFSVNVNFVDEYNKNFHVSPDDTVAIDLGTTSVEILSIATQDIGIYYDIDGNYRRQFDIGADEASIDHVGTIWESGNGDFTTLSAWESGTAGLQSDLVATTTATFSTTNSSGTFTKGNTYIGQTSGATATLEHKASTTEQVLLSSISGTFVSGEVISDGFGTTTLQDAGNPANAVARIDGTWSTPDTTAVTIDGWTTGANNHIRIYTTDAARHQGVWDNNKYRLYPNTSLRPIIIYSGNTKVDGLQISSSYSGTWFQVFYVSSNGVGYELSNSILNGNNLVTDGIYTTTGISSMKIKIWNNIIYGVIDTAIRENYTGTASTWDVFNNTIYNCNFGLRRTEAIVSVSNNITQVATDGFNGSFSAQSDYNISVIAADAPGAHSKNSTTVTFRDSTNNDFRLSTEDTVARNAGTNARSVTSDLLYDIEGEERYDAAWDIGADEGATVLYRSVGNDTRNLAPAGVTVTISSTTNTATFSATLDDNIGVGDVIQYGQAGYYKLAFIAARASSTQYTIHNRWGMNPIATTTASAKVYRVYEKLSDWNAHLVANIQPSLDDSVDDLALTDRNLIASNTAEFLPCYASTTPDDETINTTYANWTIGSSTNYIKIYTPVNENEVGISQRHSGIWSDTAYRLVFNNEYFDLEMPYTIIDGVQVYNETGSVAAPVAFDVKSYGVHGSVIRNSIIRGGDFTGSTQPRGVYSNSSNNTSTTTMLIYNNIFYNYTNGTDGYAVYFSSGYGNMYNNTLYGNYYGVRINQSNSIIKNNVLFNNVNDIHTITNFTDYNASDDLDGTNPIDISPGLIESDGWFAAFTDYANGDVSVRNIYSPLFDAGTTITIVTDDILGNARPYFDTHDVGAFEFITDKPEFRFSPGGTFKIRGKVQFK